MASHAALDERSEAPIEGWARSGRYASADEAVRDGLRVLEALERSEDARLEALRAEIRTGLDGGPPAPLDMDAVRAEGRRRLWLFRNTSTHGA